MRTPSIRRPNPKPLYRARSVVRGLVAASCMAALALVAGCASLNSVDNEVTSFGEWPAGRAPGTYAFDRLPSQAARPDRQARLEQIAALALAQAGFRPATQGALPDLTVQIGARVDVTEIVPWADPLWWHGGFGGYYAYPAIGPGPRPWWVRGAWVGPGPWWGPGPYDRDTRYSRQVALLLRDRASGQPLYEAHAETNGSSAGSERLIAAMFAATLAEFPRAEGRPHSVVTMLPPPPAPPASAPAAPEAPASSPPPLKGS
jgi:hypothetical protein